MAHLLLRGAVDRLPEAFASITLTLFVPLTLAAFGIVLRGSSFAFRKEVFRTRDRRNFGAAFAIVLGARAVLHGRGGRGHRLRAGARRRPGRRSRGTAGSTPPRSWGACWPWRSWPTCPPSTWSGTPAGPTTRHGRVLPAPGRRGRGRGRRAWPFAGIFVLHARRALPLPRPHARGRCPWSSCRRCAASARWCCWCAQRPPRRPAAGHRRGGLGGAGLGRGPVALRAPPDDQGLAGGRPAGTLEAILVVFGCAVVIILPRSACSSCSTSAACSPVRAHRIARRCW